MLLRNAGTSTAFRIAGEADKGNPSCIPDRVIQQWRKVVRLLGHHRAGTQRARAAQRAAISHDRMLGCSVPLDSAASHLVPEVGYITIHVTNRRQRIAIAATLASGSHERPTAILRRDLPVFARRPPRINSLAVEGSS